MSNSEKNILNRLNVGKRFDLLDDKLDSNSNELSELNSKFVDFQEKVLNEINSLNLENKNLRNENETISKELNKIIENNKCLSMEIKLLDGENTKIIKDNNTLSSEIKSLKEENTKMIEDNNVLTSKIDSLKKENDKIKKNFKKNNKILDSYNDHFKSLFYLYELKPVDFLKDYQDICQEVLNFVSNVCRKYDLEYWLEAGTHLGAVRHGGFIPWDDDIDVGMMRKDYEKFLEVGKFEIKQHNLEKNLKMRLLRHGNNILYFIQISYSGFAILDIFPSDYIENPPDNIKELYFKEKSNFKSNILNGMGYSDAVKEIYSHLNLSYEPQSFVIPGVERSAKGVFHVQDVNELFPLKKILFRGTEYYSFKNDDYHLTKLYGDWESLPKVLKRHNRMYKVKNMPNINKKLKTNLDLLKKVNETYENNG